MIIGLFKPLMRHDVCHDGVSPNFQSDLMKTFILALLPFVLTGCTITKQAQVSEASAVTGVVRLTYNQAMLQTARTDDYVTQGTATKECQRLGYASAEAFGQPVSTCSVYAGSLCLNTKITLAWQCRGVAVSQSPSFNY
ncbi:hypothetical protein CIT292_06659 [Citrobacter youngae ATCC 29220]|uniref:Outer membrane lipoprotein n=2 Tax=Citrobacter youngae TaxID=133448 RepID=D4B881_9ENTR|nr:hypothetical protein CIT292_06659 [Citrobacter youngae ATCC 29220]